MLALTDEALARLVIGATRVRPHARARWLRDLACRLDPDPRPLSRQGRWRARQRDGAAIYRLTGRLTEVEALHHVRVERAIAAGSESEVAT